MNRIETLLEGLNDWRNNTGKFMDRLPIIKHEQGRYLPTFYRTEAWYLEELAKAWDLENESNVFPVKSPKKVLLTVEKI